MPPIRNSGKIATAMPIKPIPPSQCSSDRQISRPGDRLSRPTSTVAPVAVMPDMLSKKASVTPLSPANMKGRAAKLPTTIQLETVSMYMSRGRSWLLRV